MGLYIYIYLYSVYFLGIHPLLKGSQRGFDAARELSQKGFFAEFRLSGSLSISLKQPGEVIYQIQNHPVFKKKIINHLMDKKHFTRTTKKKQVPGPMASKIFHLTTCDERWVDRRIS